MVPFRNYVWLPDLLANPNWSALVDIVEIRSQCASFDSKVGLFMSGERYRLIWASSGYYLLCLLKSKVTFFLAFDIIFIFGGELFLPPTGNRCINFQPCLFSSIRLFLGFCEITWVGLGQKFWNYDMLCCVGVFKNAYIKSLTVCVFLCWVTGSHKLQKLKSTEKRYIYFASELQIFPHYTIFVFSWLWSFIKMLLWMLTIIDLCSKWSPLPWEQKSSLKYLMFENDLYIVETIE